MVLRIDHELILIEIVARDPSLKDCLFVRAEPHDMFCDLLGLGLSCRTEKHLSEIISLVAADVHHDIHKKLSIKLADVSVNIYAFLKAQETGKVVELSCAIGDETIDGRPYEEIVEIARKYIQEKGGFEKFAEWGLV